MNKIILCTLLVSSSLPVVAAGLSQGQPYVNAEIGITDLATDKSINPDNYAIGDTGYTIRGGYVVPVQEKLKVGLEGGYLELGQSTFGVDPWLYTIKQHGGDLLAVVDFAVGTHFSLIGKAGAAYVTQKQTLGDLDLGDANGIKPELAGGFAVNFNKNIALTATASHIFADEINSDTTDPVNTIASSSSLLAGFKVTFG